MFLKPWVAPLALWLMSTVDAKTRSSNISHYGASSYPLSVRLSDAFLAFLMLTEFE